MSHHTLKGLVITVVTITLVLFFMFQFNTSKAEPTQTPTHHSELKKKIFLNTVQDFSIEVPEGRELHYVIRCYDVDTNKITKMVWSHNTWEVDEENIRYFDADLNRSVKFIPKDERCSIVQPLNVAADYLSVNE